MPGDRLQEITGIGRHAPKLEPAQLCVLVGDRFAAVGHAQHGMNRFWDPTMKAYLADVRNPAKRDVESRYTWQGIIRRNGPGYPSYCYPLCDLVIQGKFCTVFDGNRIIAVSD